MTITAASAETAAMTGEGAELLGRPLVNQSGAPPSPDAAREGAPIVRLSRAAHPIIDRHLGRAPC